MDKKDEGGWTPLTIAGWRRPPFPHETEAEALITISAASAGDTEVMRELVGAGANVNATTSLGTTPL